MFSSLYVLLNLSMRWTRIDILYISLIILLQSDREAILWNGKLAIGFYKIETIFKNLVAASFPINLRAIYWARGRKRKIWNLVEFLKSGGRSINWTLTLLPMHCNVSVHLPRARAKSVIISNRILQEVKCLTKEGVTLKGGFDQSYISRGSMAFPFGFVPLPFSQCAPT